VTEPSPAPDPAAPPADEVPSVAVRRAVVVTVVATSAAGALGTAFLPYLVVHHPALLLATSADARNLLLTVPTLDPWWVFVIGVPRRALSMLSTYGLGLVYGRAIVAWSAKRMPRVARLLHRLEALFSKLERPLLVVWPVYVTSALSGVSKMPLRRFVPYMLVGQVAYVILALYLGDAASAWTQEVTAFFERNLWQSTAVFVGLVLAQQAYAYAKRRRARSLRATSTEPSPEA